MKPPSALSAATAPATHDALVLTWTVNQCRPSKSGGAGGIGGGGGSLFAAAADLSRAADVAVFCLQEVETGGSSVALAAARELAAPASQEKGNSNAQWWAQALHEALAGGVHAWGRVGLRQLSGMVNDFFFSILSFLSFFFASLRLFSHPLFFLLAVS